MLEERPLPVVLFDQNPPHDHPARRTKPRGLVGNLAHPLLDRAQRAITSLLGFLSAVVRCAPAARGTASLLAISAWNKGLPILLGNRLDKRRTILIQPTPDRKVRSRIDGLVEDIGSIEVGISSYNGVSKMALDQRQHLLESLGRRVRWAGTTRLVHYLKTLSAAAKRNHQRLIRPTPVVAKVSSLLLYPIKRLDMPVEIHQRKLVLLSATTNAARQLRPYRLLNLVDPPREMLDILRCPKASQKVPRRGRVRNPTRSHQAAHRFAPLQRRLVLQTRPVGAPRVGQRQHMVRLMIRRVALKQRQCVVQPLCDPKPSHKLLRQYQPSIVRYLAP